MVCCHLTPARLLLVTLAALAAAYPIGTDAAQQPKSFQVGMARSFFEDSPKILENIAAEDFQRVMKKTTGLDGRLHSKDDAFEVAAKLMAKELGVGIFFGHEFAWVQEKHPDLKPLLVAINKRKVDRAHVVVHQRNPAKTIADLEGKSFAIALGTSGQCRLFVERHGADRKPRDAGKFFGSIEKPLMPADALDDVARGKVEATVVDTIALEFYKETKGPVFARNLKVLQESDVFPPPVIAYLPGALDDATIKQFKDGLLKAHLGSPGSELMAMWDLEAFTDVPPGFDKSLADTLRTYPAPAR